MHALKYNVMSNEWFGNSGSKKMQYMEKLIKICRKQMGVQEH
jgi:hypothetical protein